MAPRSTPDYKTPAFLSRCVDQALSRSRADLVIKDTRFLNVVTGEIARGDIAVCGDRIVGTYGSYDGIEEIDGRDLICVPGFIDTHVHCESTLVSPMEFDRCVLPRGTTTAICDPHEMCNVLGRTGLDYFTRAAERTALDLRVQMSSCVPATHLETSAATLSAADLKAFHSHPKALGLAEFMNVPGVLNKDPGVMGKAGGFSGWRHRRSFAAARRQGSERLSVMRHSELPRNHDAARSPGEAAQGNATADPGGHGIQGRGRADTGADGRNVVILRFLYR